MIKEVVANQVMVENAMAAQIAQDEETRKAFLESLPEFIGKSVKELLDEISDEEFKSCFRRSGADFVQYEIRAEAVSGSQIENKEVRHDIVDCGNTATGKWLAKLLKYDAEHISKLNHPKRSGGGAGQYLKEGLFRINNCGELNRVLEDVIKMTAGTNEYVRLLVGSEWGKCNVILTLTFPKANN